MGRGARVTGMAGLVLAGVWAAPAHGQVTDSVASIAARAAEDYPGLAVSVLRGREVVFEQGFGFTDPDGVTPARPDQPFNVYSVAKMLTGIAVLREVRAGRLDPDRSVRAYLPGLPEALEPVTPALLLGHLSGIGAYASDADWDAFSSVNCREPSDALPHFIHRPLESAPGHERRYTTYGYVLLSAVLAATHPSGSYTEAMHDLVFGPAGMEATRLDHPGATRATPMARTAGGGWEAIEVDASCKFGGGGFLSSARDLARFGRAMWDGTLLSPEALSTALTPFRTSDGEVTGYGWGMDTNVFRSDGELVRWARHSGGSPGGRSFVVVLPDQQVSVGIAANADGPSLRVPALRMAYLVAGVDPG